MKYMSHLSFSNLKTERSLGSDQRKIGTYIKEVFAVFVDTKRIIEKIGMFNFAVFATICLLYMLEVSSGQGVISLRINTATGKSIFMILNYISM